VCVYVSVCAVCVCYVFVIQDDRFPLMLTRMRGSVALSEPKAKAKAKAKALGKAAAKATAKPKPAAKALRLRYFAGSVVIMIASVSLSASLLLFCCRIDFLHISIDRLQSCWYRWCGDATSVGALAISMID
jgi:hypothetical protein